MKTAVPEFDLVSIKMFTTLSYSFFLHNLILGYLSWMGKVLVDESPCRIDGHVWYIVTV